MVFIWALSSDPVVCEGQPVAQRKGSLQIGVFDRSHSNW